MRQIRSHHLAALLAEHEAPCISLYQPTHRHHPDNQQDPIRYRNLVDELESSLSRSYPGPEVDSLLERLRARANDDEFWNRRTEGLAILSSADTFEVFDLQRSVPARAVVADSFHIKPLLRIVQSADRYQILCLDRHGASLYEGNRDALDPVDLTDVPATITEALGEGLTEPHLTVASYGGAPGGGQGRVAMHHGHGGKSAAVENDTERFFRVLDRAIIERHSRPSGLPLMLAALAEYHEPFRRVSHNPNLLSEGIVKNPDAIDLDDLRAEAWKILEPRYLQRLEKLVDEFEAARARQRGADDLSDIAAAAVAGRVASMLVDADRVIPGTLDRSTGRIQRGELGDPDRDDLLDDLAEAVLRTKGEVVVVPSGRMPTETGAAATYRY
jgi:hypothetical protein